MTVYELIQELAEYPANAKVMTNVTGSHVQASSEIFGRECKVNFEDIKGNDVSTYERSGTVFLDISI